MKRLIITWKILGSKQKPIQTKQSVGVIITQLLVHTCTGVARSRLAGSRNFSGGNAISSVRRKFVFLLGPLEFRFVVTIGLGKCWLDCRFSWSSALVVQALCGSFYAGFSSRRNFVGTSCWIFSVWAATRSSLTLRWRTFTSL